MIRYFIGAILIFSTIGFYLLQNEKKTRLDGAGLNAINEAKEEKGLAKNSQFANSLVSPFGTGGLKNINQEEIILKRKQRMLADSLITPDNYFKMQIRELSELAESGDVFAMLQLGERYWSEADSLAYDPDANLRENPRKIATRYFEDAFRGGAINIPVVVGRCAYESGDIIEAAASDIMARRIGQNANSDIYARSNAFGNLSVEQMTAVGVRAKEISSQLGVPLL